MRHLPKKQAGAGRPGGRFTQHRRLDILRQMLESHPGGLALTELAKRLHVTQRSVRRYLQELDAQTELESIPTAPGRAHVWRIKPSERGRAVLLRRAQAYGLFATRHVFEPMRGSALFDELDVALRQLLQVAQRPARAPTKGEVPADSKLEDRFLVLAPPARNYGLKRDELDDIFQSVANLKPIRIRYEERTKNGDLQSERLLIYPYSMLILEGGIFVIGREPTAAAMRVFALDGIRETSCVDAPVFAIPDSFRVHDYWHGYFGISADPARFDVLVEFDARAGEQIRLSKFHPTQKVAVAPDGRVRLSMCVADLAKVAAWVLSYGASARVLGPPELVAHVVDALRGALVRYASKAQ